ncbi:hypothetical protein PGT21_029955 [Puccinia graminis f. sp. tritici]|uniref:Uncharacterized protein n=1 Tax=Puccinia graminis f. sp. tritici TaxID=56615 RepID=A0A5B0R2T0_PUCGR|nr:hypothetical protein PGT21_029955 [Puccinia graminis f. sp. tritici]
MYLVGSKETLPLGFQSTRYVYLADWKGNLPVNKAPVPRVLAPPGPGPAPRGLDLAGRAGVGPWHWPKSGLAEPKLWAHQITDIDYHHHHTRDPPS